MIKNRNLFLILSILFNQQPVTANSTIDDDLSLIYGSDNSSELESIATGHPIPRIFSPSVTSVITSQDIDRIGARRLTEVLEYLPGVHVSYGRNGTNIIGFRGVYSESNSQVLVLINDIPLRSVQVGGKPYLWDMPVKNISRIEVIRGPGSMLYGGEATTGVINVVLKTGKELKGGDVGSFVGNMDTYDGWAEYGDKQGDLEYSFSVQGGTTNGFRGEVEQDAQTVIDNFFHTNASNAPGFTNNGRDDIDARLNLNYNDTIQLRMGYQGYSNQTGVGSAMALDNLGLTKNDMYSLDLSFNNKLNYELSNKSTFYFFGQDINSDINILPPGTFGGLLPLGARNVNGESFQGTAGLTTQFNYTGLEKHIVTFGTGYVYNWVTVGENKINYIITPQFVQQIPLTEASTFGNDPLVGTKHRSNYYALFQDEWNIAPDWYLTTGFRFDYYSDVSPGYSPRIALVWNADLNTTAKLIYSRAFRPPSLLEQSFPTIQGTEIKPEVINTLEMQIENKWSADLTTSANIYWFNQENLILSTNTSSAAVPISFYNNKEIEGIGLESEVKYKFTDQFDISASYSKHYLTNSLGSGYMPEDMIKGLINWEVMDNFQIGGQLNWIGDRKRSSDDPRSDLDGYFIAGLTLSTTIAKPLEFTMRINNLFDSVAKEPSLSHLLLPGDIPVTGRTFLGQIKFTF
jgi:iron complex outermembrane receptor protein